MGNEKLKGSKEFIEFIRPTFSLKNEMKNLLGEADRIYAKMREIEGSSVLSDTHFRYVEEVTDKSITFVGTSFGYVTIRQVIPIKYFEGEFEDDYRSLLKTFSGVIDRLGKKESQEEFLERFKGKLEEKKRKEERDPK